MVFISSGPDVISKVSPPGSGICRSFALGFVRNESLGDDDPPPNIFTPDQDFVPSEGGGQKLMEPDFQIL